VAIRPALGKSQQVGWSDDRDNGPVSPVGKPSTMASQIAQFKEYIYISEIEDKVARKKKMGAETDRG
jgi:hypothetical protein